MPFVKLDCGILNSTLWIDRVARELFITSLLMAEPFEVVEDTPQIEIGSLEFTGWNVPPGWYGFVHAAGPGIIHRAGYDDQRGPLFASAMEALRRLGEPEPESRSKQFDGRRMVRVDGGFIVLNYLKYREKDATTADRSRRWRERKKAQSTHRDDTTTRVIRHQAEAEAEVVLRDPPIIDITTSASSPPNKPNGNGNGHSARASAPLHDPDPKLSERAGRLLERYTELFTELRKGARTRLTHNRHEFDEACELVKTWDDARLEKIMRVILTTDDEYISRTDRAFRIIAMKASWADDRLRQVEAERGH